MPIDDLYHDGMRRLQDVRETHPLADRLNQVTVRTAFTDEDRAFIQRCAMFFVATVPIRAACPARARARWHHAGDSGLRRQRHVPHLGQCDGEPARGTALPRGSVPNSN